jgi:uncharacterized protein (TIGR02453 family)
MAGFAGFSPDALKFLKALKKNNTREWFQPRKEEYERLWRMPMIELVGSLQAEMVKFAPAYAQQDPAKGVMRVYRDTRFSKDKTPYKTHVAGGLRRGGTGKEGGGFYFHIDDQEVLVAGGVYAPMPDELRAIREYLAGNYEAFRKITSAARFRVLVGSLQGEELTRVPKGFDPEHPAADLLRKKQFYFHATLDASVATTAALQEELLKRIKAMAPAVEMLNIPLLGLVKGKESRFLSDFA